MQVICNRAEKDPFPTFEEDISKKISSSGLVYPIVSISKEISVSFSKAAKVCN